MAYSPRPATSMSHPDRWLAVLRIVVGLYFAKAFVTKLGIVMVGACCRFPARRSAGSPQCPRSYPSKPRTIRSCSTSTFSRIRC